MRIIRPAMHWTLAIGIALAMPLFIACQDGEPVTTDDAMDAAENAAEDTGRVLEEAAEKVEDAAEDAAHDMGDLVEDTADEVEDAADSLNN